MTATFCPVVLPKHVSYNLLNATLSDTVQVLSALHQTVRMNCVTWQELLCTCLRSGSNCYIPVPTAVIAQVSIMRNPLLFIAVSVVPTCPATQSAKKDLINTCCDILQLSACSGRGDKRRTVTGRS